MKRYILAIAAALTMTLSASAMSYNEAQTEAQYLTDKMAAELALTGYEYEQAYRINLDYLLSVGTRADLYTRTWELRNQALRALLSPAQWSRYIAASYFYRPLAWANGAFVHNIYVKYPRHLARADAPRKPAPVVKQHKRMEPMHHKTNIGSRNHSARR